MGSRENEKGGIREITQPIFSRNFAPKEKGKVAKGACMIENFFFFNSEIVVNFKWNNTCN